MDIEYLLVLQGLRESLGSAVENFFVLTAIIGEGPVLMACAMIVYWCIDKRAGQLALTSFTMAEYFGQFLKNIVCVYRPWIRDARIIPAAGALEGAHGYSFPSGHTMGTATVNGSLVCSFWHRWRWVSVLLLIVLVIVMFGRNYLGVHTPQDVLVGLLIALVAIFLANKFLDWIDDYPEYEVYVVVVALVLTAVCLAVVGLKPYDVLTDANGQPLIDVVSMQKGAYEGAGVLAGWALGWFLERRMVDFSTDSFYLSMRERLIRLVIGVGCVGITYVATSFVFKAIMPAIWAKFLSTGLVMFVAMFVVPLVFSLFERPKQQSVW